MNANSPAPITQDPLTLAVDAAGGVGKLAENLGLRQNVVSNWRMRGSVPREYLAAIERATGVRCELFDESVEWVRDKKGRVTHYIVRAA